MLYQDRSCTNNITTAIPAEMSCKVFFPIILSAKLCKDCFERNHSCPIIHLQSRWKASNGIASGFNCVLISHAYRWGKWAELWFSLWLQRSVTQDDISVVGLWESNSSCGRGSVLQLLAPSRRLGPVASPHRSSNAPRTFPKQPSFSSSHYVSLRQLGPFGEVSQKKAGLSVYQSQFAIYSAVRWRHR